MENNDGRFVGIGLIWIGIGLGIGMTNASSDSLNFFNALISLVLVMGAIKGTEIMWTGDESHKAKREDQIGASDAYSNLLIQLMTEEERQTMRARLINTVANDGELPTSGEINTEKYQTTT